MPRRCGGTLRLQEKQLRRRLCPLSNGHLRSCGPFAGGTYAVRSEIKPLNSAFARQSAISGSSGIDPQFLKNVRLADRLRRERVVHSQFDSFLLSF
jgi:hypothetical protein